MKFVKSAVSTRMLSKNDIMSVIYRHNIYSVDLELSKIKDGIYLVDIDICGVDVAFNLLNN